MSTNEAKLSPINFKDIVLKQYLYKLKGHSGLFYSLIFIQLVITLFSFGQRSGMSSGSDHLSISIYTYSGDVFLIFSFIWMAVVTSLLGSRAYQSMDSSVITDRTAGNAANIMLIITYALFAGITATLMSIPQRLILAMNLKESEFLYEGLQIVPQELLLGMLVASLYLILLAAVIYFIQMVSNRSKVSGIVLLVVIFAFAFGYVVVLGFNFGKFIRFFTGESSLALFFLKTVLTAAIFFGLSILVSKRMEVKR